MPNINNSPKNLNLNSENPKTPKDGNRSCLMAKFEKAKEKIEQEQEKLFKRLQELKTYESEVNQIMNERAKNSNLNIPKISPFLQDTTQMKVSEKMMKMEKGD